MEKSPQLPDVPSLTDFQSRGGLRSSAENIYRYLLTQRVKLQTLFSQTAAELYTLYGEASFSGTPAPLTINVPGAVPGFPVVVTFDQDNQGVAFSGYVSAPDTVAVLMTGASPTLAAGKIRCWISTRTLP